jgi:hypothetical protein
MEREKIRELAHLMIKPKYKQWGDAMFFQMTLSITYQRAKEYTRKMEEIGILRTYEEVKNSVDINNKINAKYKKQGDRNMALGSLDYRLIKKSVNPVNKIIDEYFDAQEEELKKELIETNEQLKKDNALAELKNWKDKLDLELISKEEYDKHKKRLGAIIMKD